MAKCQAEDCQAFISDLKEEDSRLRLKRRYLMDLHLSQRERKRIKKLLPLSNESIPETILREDDVYYDNIKNFVERVSGAATSVKKHEICQQKLFESVMDIKNISSVLDDMTNKGLCSLSELVTEGDVIEFEKTRWKMKKIIKKFLPSYLGSKDDDLLQMRKDQITSLFNNPHYFTGNHEDLCSPFDRFRGSAITVLNLLNELPTQTLEAMDRRLKGKSVSSKGRIKRDLVATVSFRCMKMLSELDDKKLPPESLIEALSIASVTLKLILGHTDVTQFKRFSPEIETLQKSIVNAIRCVIFSKNKFDKNVLEKACKRLLLSLGHEVEDSKGNLRFAVRNLLIEYLVECSYMESIPKPLVEMLNGINNKYLESSLKNDGEDEVEFLLCFSAQIKQIIWDILPHKDVDRDFANAYMEDDDEDDEDYTNEFLMSRNFKLDSNEADRVSESIGEINPDVNQEPLDFSSFSCRNPSISRVLEDIEEAKPDKSELKTKGIEFEFEFDIKAKQKEFDDNIDQQQCTSKNEYIWIQRACDETAMAMHRVVDGILMESRKA